MPARAYLDGLAVAQALRSRDDDRGGYFIQWILIMVFQSVLMIPGMMVTGWCLRV